MMHVFKNWIFAQLCEQLTRFQPTRSIAWFLWYNWASCQDFYCSTPQ